MPLKDGQVVFESGKPAAEQPGVVHKGTANGVATYEVGSGSYRFLAAVSNATSVNTNVNANVPATLALSVGNASLGALTPGVARTYTGAEHGDRHLDGRRRRAVRVRRRARPRRASS